MVDNIREDKMQIHNLNEFTGTPGENDYLAMDNGADTSKVSVPNLLSPATGRIATAEDEIDDLDARLTNLATVITPGSTSGDAEIIDARVVDGVTYPSLHDAINESFTDLKSDISNIVERLHDIDGVESMPEFTYGTANNFQDGDASVSFNTDNRYLHSGLITFYPGSVFGLSSYTDRFYTLYKKRGDGTFVRLYAQRADVIFGEQTDAYIVINYYPERAITTDELLNSVKYENTSPNFIDETKEALDKIDYYFDLFEYIDYSFTTGKYSKSGDTIDSNNDNRYIRSKIKLYPGDRIGLKDYTGKLYKIDYFDSNNAVVELYPLTSEFKAPIEADYYITVNYYPEQTTSPAELEPYFYAIRYNGIENIIGATDDLLLLAGKKVMFFGDSITEDPARYRNNLLNNTGMVQIESFAIPQATLLNNASTVMDGNPSQGSNNTIPNQVKKMLLGTYGTPDIVIVSGGINDSMTGFTFSESQFTDNGAIVPLGSVDLTTASGAMRYIYQSIISVYPNAQIFFATPLQAALPREYSDIQTKRNVIVQNAERLSASVIDAFAKSGINSLYETYGEDGKYLVDGLHPNSAGAVLVAKCYQNEIVCKLTR